MTARRNPTLHCDEPHCDKWVAGGELDPTAVVREQAAEIGWTSVVVFNGLGREDFCPAHRQVAS